MSEHRPNFICIRIANIGKWIGAMTCGLFSCVTCFGCGGKVARAPPVLYDSDVNPPDNEETRKKRWRHVACFSAGWLPFCAGCCCGCCGTFSPYEVDEMMQYKKNNVAAATTN